MEVLTRRISAHTTRCYQCSICKTKHRSAGAAKKCEARTLERQVFHRGSVVKNISPRTCLNNGRPEHYRFRGTVIKVIGPVLPDRDYERWLDGKNERLNGHVFQYEVRYRCPRCKKIKTALYYGPELRAISR